MKVYVLTCTVDDDNDNIQLFATEELAQEEAAAIRAEADFDEEVNAIRIEERWVQG
jgi:hypothetical protein